MATETFQKGGMIRDQGRAAITLPGNIKQETVAAIDTLILNQSNALAGLDTQGFSRALATVQALNDLRKALTPDIMAHVMTMQNTRLGFKTDNKGGYDVGTVKECLIEAVLHGAQPCGNEFNIIAGNSYLTLEFFRRKLREWPGLTDLVISLGVPIISDKGAVVECGATWKINGVPDSVHFRKTERTAEAEGSDTRICVKVNAGMSFDAVLGKAERKLRAKIYQRFTGSNSTLDADDPEPPKITEGNQTLFVKPGAPTGARTAKAATRIVAPTPEAYSIAIEAATSTQELNAIEANANADVGRADLSQGEYDEVLQRIRERRNMI